MIELANNGWNNWEQAKKAAEKILENKFHWNVAGNVKYHIGNKPAQQYYAEDTKQYYDKLKSLGYESLASNLESRDYNNAKKYMETFNKQMNRNQFRPYMYGKAQAFGYDKDYVDNLTRFDETTGEVFFAGKNLGKPLAIVDGVSYWEGDTLDKVWDDYVKESGITPPETDLAKQAVYSSNKLLDKLGEDYSGNREYVMNTGEEQRKRKDDFINSQQNANIYDTETAKSIMDKFNYMGGVAGGNEIANGASTNNGNIDSFSAANRARQQLAYQTAGAEAVRADYNDRMNRVLDTILSIDTQNQSEYDALNNNYNLGQGTAQQMSDNARLIYDNLNQNKLTDAEVRFTEANAGLTDANAGLVNAQANQTDVQTEGLKSDITGTVTPKIADEQNPYLDEEGKLKNVDFDYHARIKELEDKLAKTTDEAEKETIMLALSWLSRARDLKTGMPEYSQYAGEATPYAWETAGYKLEKANVKNARDIAMKGFDVDLAGIDSAERIAKYSTDAEERMNERNASAQETVANTEANMNIKMKEIDAKVQKELAYITLKDNQERRALEKQLTEAGYTASDAQTYILQKYGLDAFMKTASEENAGEDAKTAWQAVANAVAKTDNDKPKKFIEEKIIANIGTENEVDSVAELFNLIVENTETYNIDQDDALAILQAAGAKNDDEYYKIIQNDYENQIGDNKYKGMKKKEGK